MFTGTGDAAGVGFTVGALFKCPGRDAGGAGVRWKAPGRRSWAHRRVSRSELGSGEPSVQDAPVRPLESPEAPLPPSAPPAAPDEPVVVKPTPGAITAPPPPEGPTFPRDEPVRTAESAYFHVHRK